MFFGYWRESRVAVFLGAGSESASRESAAFCCRGRQRTAITIDQCRLRFLIDNALSLPYRILISADTDFGTFLSLRQETKPLTNLSNLVDELTNGCIAVFDENRMRVRALPVGGKAG
jgi:hypothetical protein